MAKFVNKKKRLIIPCIIAAAVIAVVSIILLATFVISPAVKANDTSIDHIQIKQLPKTAYVVGEEADYDGLIVEAVLNNGNTNLVNLNECTITGFSTETVTDFQVVTITYKEFSCSYHISVREAPQEILALVKIEMKSLPDKIIYKRGEWIVPTGGVLLCTYSDGSTKELDLAYTYIMDFSSDKLGEYIVRIKYQEGVYVAYTEFTVTITE